MGTRPESRWNPFRSERRIILLLGVLFMANLVMTTLFREEQKQAQEFSRRVYPQWFDLMQWSETPVGLALSALLCAGLFALYLRAAHRPGHWLRRLNFFGIRAYLFLFAMATFGWAGIAWLLALKAIL